MASSGDRIAPPTANNASSQASFAQTTLMTMISSDRLDWIKAKLSADNAHSNLNAEVVWYALSCNPVNETIVDALLAARNTDNNPIFDLNSRIQLKGNKSSTLVSLLLNKPMDPALRARLLTKILDYKNSQGVPINLDSTFHGKPLLQQAPDALCLTILLAQRTLEGEPACAIEEVYQGHTALEHANAKQDRAMVLAVITARAAITPFTLDEIARQLKKDIQTGYGTAPTKRRREKHSFLQIINFRSTKITDTEYARLADPSLEKYIPTPEKLLVTLKEKRDAIEANHRWYGFTSGFFKQPSSRLVTAIDIALENARAAAGLPSGGMDNPLDSTQSAIPRADTQSGCLAALWKLVGGCFSAN